MFWEMVTAWSWVEEGGGWDYLGNFLALWKAGLTFRSDTMFQVEVGGHMFGGSRMPGNEAVGSWGKYGGEEGSCTGS